MLTPFQVLFFQIGMNKYKLKIKFKISIIVIILFAMIFRISKQIIIDNKLRKICEERKISDEKLLEAEDLLNRGANPNQGFVKDYILRRFFGDLGDGLLIRLMTSWKAYKDPNHEKLFILLLDHGADPNAVDEMDEIFPLLAWGFNIKLEKALINHGAKLDIHMMDGTNSITVYDYILKHGRKDEIELLKNNGVHR
jgi:hypothetical protein